MTLEQIFTITVGIALCFLITGGVLFHFNLADIGVHFVVSGAILIYIPLIVIFIQSCFYSYNKYTTNKVEQEDKETQKEEEEEPNV